MGLRWDVPAGRRLEIVKQRLNTAHDKGCIIQEFHYFTGSHDDSSIPLVRLSNLCYFTRLLFAYRDISSIQ
uniref:Uncharacterized protein n=1 Tax=Trichobilharzia regenti TaxID=157069 RepID=A0AA85J9X7_TRIRE|nr:unnamed protein product [Trichobilharzia regenti]